MIDKKELLSRLSVLEKEVKENGDGQSRLKQAYKEQLSKLEKSLAEKEKLKNELGEKKPMFSFTRAGKEHIEKMAAIDKEIADIRERIAHIYDDNAELKALMARFSVIYPEYIALQEQVSEVEFRERLGENCVYIFPTGHTERDIIGVVIDGKDMGTVPSPIGVYQLEEGAHTVYVTKNYYHTENVQFRLNGNNKFIFYKFEYYGSGYSKNVSNTFDDFVRDNGLFSFNVDAIKKYILSF